MKKAKCRVTHLFNAGDIVSKLGGVIKWLPLKFAEHYGYKVKLPKYDQHIPLYSHAWSQVMYGLNALYNAWGEHRFQKPLQRIIDAKIAKK